MGEQKVCLVVQLPLWPVACYYFPDGHLILDAPRNIMFMLVLKPYKNGVLVILVNGNLLRKKTQIFSKLWRLADTLPKFLLESLS